MLAVGMTTQQFFTLSTLIGAVALINSIAIIIVWRIHSGMPGLRFWVASQSAFMLAWLPSLFVNIGVLNDPFFTAYNNSVNLGGMLLLLEGTLRFRGIGQGRTRLPWMLLVMAIIIALSYVNRSNDTARYLFHDAVAALLLSGAAAGMLWRMAPHQRLAHSMAAFYLLAEAAIYLARWGLAGAITQGWTEMSSRSFNFALFGGVAMCCLGTLYGLILSINAEAKRQVILTGLIDPLTGLDNRRALEQELVRALAQRSRTGGLLGLVYFDLDRFKPINDHWGHAVGDAVLMAVAGRLRQDMRTQDVAARIGGDEFVVLLPGLEQPAALETVARRLHKAVEGPLLLDLGSVDIRVSMGTALAPLHGEIAEDLLRRADNMMYEHKRARQAPELLSPMLTTELTTELQDPTPS
jgi:diguanylate cyclase (GGDEF)-like protein